MDGTQTISHYPGPKLGRYCEYADDQHNHIGRDQYGNQAFLQFHQPSLIHFISHGYASSLFDPIFVRCFLMLADIYCAWGVFTS